MRREKTLWIAMMSWLVLTLGAAPAWAIIIPKATSGYGNPPGLGPCFDANSSQIGTFTQGTVSVDCGVPTNGVSDTVFSFSFNSSTPAVQVNSFTVQFPDSLSNVGLNDVQFGLVTCAGAPNNLPGCTPTGSNVTFNVPDNSGTVVLDQSNQEVFDFQNFRTSSGPIMLYFDTSNFSSQASVVAVATSPVSTIPEPSCLLLFGSGLLTGLGYLRHRAGRKSS